MMNKWISILSGLLVLQLIVAVVVNLTGEEYGAFQADEKLVAFDKLKVDRIRIDDGVDSVVLQKRDDQWLLPESDDFPANQAGVQRLLDTLSDLEKGWPVATTAGAARRFKVDDEAFERKLTLLANEEPLAELYVGTSPGFRKVHVRPAGEDAVFAAAFNTWEANAEVDDWIDAGFLSLEESEVERVELPGFALQQTDGELQVSDLGDSEETIEEEARSLLGRLTGLRIESLLGTEAKPEFRQDQPALEVKLVRKGGDVLDYRFSKPKEGAYYVLKRSDVDHYFQVAEFTVKPIEETTRAKLVQAKADEATMEEREGLGPEVAKETAE